MTECCAKRHTTAETDDRHTTRCGMQEQRHVCHQLLREHVAAIRGVGLSVHSQGRRTGESLDGHRRWCAVLVVQQCARLELRFEVEILGYVGGIQIHTACQKLAVPLRRNDDGHKCETAHHVGCGARSWAGIGVQHQHDGRADEHERSRRQGGRESEPRNQHEPCRQRARYRTDGVDGVHQAEASCGGVRRGVRGVTSHRECEWERTTEADSGWENEQGCQQHSLTQECGE